MMNLIDRRITVTGGAGFLGSVLVNHLRALGCKNIFVPMRHEYDLTQPGDIEHFFAKARPEVLFRLAAAAGGSRTTPANTCRSFFCQSVLGHSPSANSPPRSGANHVTLRVMR